VHGGDEVNFHAFLTSVLDRSQVRALYTVTLGRNMTQYPLDKTLTVVVVAKTKTLDSHTRIQTAVVRFAYSYCTDCIIMSSLRLSYVD